MNILLLLCSLMALRLVAADVSHLNMESLPPMMQNHALVHSNGHNMQSQQKTTTSIEKQVLRELPEQIEYGPSAQYGSDMMPMMNNMMMMMHNNVTMMMPMPSEVMTPPPPVKTSTFPAYSRNAPSMQYLPPNMHHAAPQQQQMRQQQHQRQHQHQVQHSMSPMLRTQYLPPTIMPSSQYHQQEMQPASQIHTSMATSFPLEMPESEKQYMMEYTQAEPQPAHMLTAKGYQYKTGTAFSTSSLSSTSSIRRFRLKQ